MAYKALIVAFSLITAAPAVASVQAHAASESDLYCMKGSAFTGSRTTDAATPRASAWPCTTTSPAAASAAP